MKKLQSEIEKPKRSFNPAVDDRNWQTLFETQFQNLQSKNAISNRWIEGFAKLGIDNSKMPTMETLTKVAKTYTGYTFIQTTESVIYEQIDWYNYILKYEMPISGFLRTPEELSYCDEPDNWHEIMGHVPFLVNKEYSDMYQALAKLYVEAYTKKPSLLPKVDFISGYFIELGLIRENGSVKALGATLYSSSSELEAAYKPENQRDFTLEALETESRGYERESVQGQYYVLDSFEQIMEAINYVRKQLDN